MGNQLAIPLSSGWPTAAAAALGGRAFRRRRRVEGILWMTREEVGEGDGGDRVEHHLLLLVHPRTQG